MDRDQQAEFVKELVGNVTEQVLKEIDAGKIPDNWDGIELRELLKLRFAAAAYVKMQPRRKRDFNNTVLVNNL